ncbi:MAG: hypothetical protein GY795_41855 [Desulfobacterales bacterium]|nr:hypothetical protein [Desulfobacterales bacterium]
MKKIGFADRQENTENTVFLFRLFVLSAALAGVLQLCPFTNITVYIIPVCNLFMLWPAFRLAVKGTDAPVVPVLVIGILFIAGGTVFDLSSAVVGSPDLKREGNYYTRVPLNSGHSPAFAYFYLFLDSVVAGGLGIALLTALLKNRSLTVSRMSLSKKSSLTVSDSDLYFLFFWITALFIISSNIYHWVDGTDRYGIVIIPDIIRKSEISHIISLYFCLSIYTVLLFRSYRQLYQPESEVRFRLYTVSAVLVYTFITAFGILYCLRDYENKEMLTYMDDIINYAAENNLMNRYAEIDDTIQKITSNPYTGKKQTNGADALWEYCSHNTEERRQEFVSSVIETANMLKFSERLKPDDRPAATVDSFSTEIADKAWMHNVFFIEEKWYPCDGRSRKVLSSEYRFPALPVFYYYSKIMAVRIYRLHRQGNKNTAKELYMKTLHMSRILFNSDSSVSNIFGLLAMRNLCRDEIISSEIFSEYERKHLNRFKENVLFLLKNDAGISRKYDIPKKLAEPLIFYYPDRYKKVLALLESHRDRNYIIPVFYEMLAVKESLGILDRGSGILFPLPDDRRFKEIMRIFNTENKLFLKKAIGCVEKNIETCKSENCSLAEHNKYLTDSRFKKFIYSIASEWNCKALLWYLRPFVWNESLINRSATASRIILKRIRADMERRDGGNGVKP